MKRFLLFFLFFLTLTGLRANGNYDLCLFDSIKIPLQSANNQIAQSDSNLASHKDVKTQSTSDVISTLTLVVNSFNNALTSTNNQVTVWSLLLTLITIIVAGIGLFGFFRLRNYIQKLEEIRKRLDNQQRKDELRDFYMERINEWMFAVTEQLADNLISGPTNNDAKYQAFKKTYRGYYITKLSVTNIPVEKKLSEKKEQAIKDIKQALDQIVGGGDLDDLKRLQEMAEFEMNKEKKKMLKKAAEELQDRLIKK